MKLKPYKILFWTIPFTFLPVIVTPKSLIGIHLHDTYFVISPFTLFVLLGVILGFLTTVYWLFRKYRLFYSLSLTHSILTSFLAISITLATIAQEVIRVEINYENFKKMSLIKENLVILFIVLQIILVTNVIVGLLRGKRKEIG